MTIPLQIAVCEDDPHDRQWLLELIEGSGKAVRCERFEDGEALLANFFVGKYDLVFFDIYMGGMQGVDAAHALRETDKDVMIAFTTSSPDHTRESYRLGALKYIEKPVHAEDVEEALRLAALKRRDRGAYPGGRSITLLIGGKQTAIPLESILYFETRDHAVEVHTTSGVLKASQTVRLDDVEALLPPDGEFLRCHHSFIVNLRHVVRLDRDFVMKNGERAYIRSGDEKKCADILKRYLLDRLGRDRV